MRRRTRDILTQERGAALIFVILALVIVSIIAMAVASVVRNNLSQTVSEEDSLKAYYLALSGQDLTYSALLQVQYRIDAHGDEEEYTLLSDEYTVDAHPNVADTPTLSDNLTLDGGTVLVTIRALEKDTDRWVEITSTATLDDSGITKTLTLQFQAVNPLIQMKY